MFCKNCGKDVKDDSKYCHYCGAKLQDYDEYFDTTEEKSNSFITNTNFWGLISIILAFFIPILSIIAGIIGMKQNDDPQNHKWCKIGIGISVAWIVTVVLISIAISFLGLLFL